MRRTAIARSFFRTATTKRRRCCEMQAIEAYGRGGFPELVLQGKQEFVENYSFGTAYWQGANPRRRAKVVAELKTNLKDLAQYYHAEAQRSKNVADYQEAAKWYRSYLNSFRDDPDAAATNYPARRHAVREQAISRCGQGIRATPPTATATMRKAAAGYAAIVAYGKGRDAERRCERPVHRRHRQLAEDSPIRFRRIRRARSC
jgi:cellulose synthase operon protein C